MLHESYPSEEWVKQHPDMARAPEHVTHTLLLVDYHGEYPLPDPSTCPKASHGDHNGYAWEARVECVFDQYKLDDIFGEEAVCVLLQSMPKGLTDAWGTDPGHIHSVYGTVAQHQFLFRAFYATLFGNSTGGDCDTFDYWPNAMGIARQWADDLDQIMQSTAHIDELKASYIVWLRDVNGGPVPEYTFDNEPMPEENEEHVMYVGEHEPEDPERFDGLA